MSISKSSVNRLIEEFNPFEARVRFPDSKWISKSTPKSSEKVVDFGNIKQQILERSVAVGVSSP